METYYVTAYETYVRDYKVEAESKEEAIQQVKDGNVDHYADDFYGIQVDKEGVQTEEEENSWQLKDGLVQINMILFGLVEFI